MRLTTDLHSQNYTVEIIMPQIQWRVNTFTFILPTFTEDSTGNSWQEYLEDKTVIRSTYGKYANSISLTQALLEERENEREREKKKFDKLAK